LLRDTPKIDTTTAPSDDFRTSLEKDSSRAAGNFMERFHPLVFGFKGKDIETPTLRAQKVYGDSQLFLGHDNRAFGGASRNGPMPPLLAESSVAAEHGCLKDAIQVFAIGDAMSILLHVASRLIANSTKFIGAVR